MKYFKFARRIIWWAFVFYIVAILLEYSRQGFVNDLSLQKIESEVRESKDIVYLVSYVDGGDLFWQNQNAMSQFALNKGIDFILNYKKKHLDHEFTKENELILSSPTGAGMWLWKPYVILKTMHTAPEGAIIIYLDSAFYIKKPVTHLIDMMGSNDVLLVHDRDRKNGSYIKGDSFALTGCFSEDCRNGDLLWGAIVVVRNNKESRAFIQEWLSNSKDPRILSGENSGIKENYPEYLWHHYDQSVLSLVYQNNKIAKVNVIEFVDVKKYIAWFHRKDSKISPLKSWYSVYGSDPVVNLSETGKELPSSALLNTPLIVRLRKFYIENFM